MRLCQPLRWMRSVVSMGMLLMATTAFAADHVLIMAISNYARAPLPGVRHDPQNALQLAERLGYDTAGATVLRDADLSGQAMRQALQKLSDQVRSNDRLFFYFFGPRLKCIGRFTVQQCTGRPR
jgi:predicted Zn-dependent protease